MAVASLSVISAPCAISGSDDPPTFDGLPQGSWMSWADAGTLAAIQYGEILFETGSLPVDTDPQLVEAAQGWEIFFRQFENDPKNEDKLREFWGQAEQLGVNYGVELADAQVSRPDGPEGDLIDRFTEVGNLYRAVNASGQAWEFGTLSPGFLPELLESYYDVELSDLEAAALRAPAIPFMAVSGPPGEWFYDPRSEIPLIDLNPAAVAAMLLELKLLAEEE